MQIFDNRYITLLSLISYYLYMYYQFEAGAGAGAEARAGAELESSIGSEAVSGAAV